MRRTSFKEELCFIFYTDCYKESEAWAPMNPLCFSADILLKYFVTLLAHNVILYNIYIQSNLHPRQKTGEKSISTRHHSLLISLKNWKHGQNSPPPKVLQSTRLSCLIRSISAFDTIFWIVIIKRIFTYDHEKRDLID